MIRLIPIHKYNNPANHLTIQDDNPNIYKKFYKLIKYSLSYKSPYNSNYYMPNIIQMKNNHHYCSFTLWGSLEHFMIFL